MTIKTLSRRDADYPHNLKFIDNAPETLYVKGRFSMRDNISVAVVGSRHASSYGLAAAQRLAAELAEAGFTIVSGLAKGIDSAAHRGALSVGGRTVAVLGSGILNVYPAENRQLAAQIEKNGAVISEYPLDAKPHSRNFPMRNRIISGLSLGTIVVEAAAKSGSLITARLALEQGREVFAMPGEACAFNSQGTHRLLRQGAKLVEGAGDVIEELENLIGAYLKHDKNEKSDKRVNEICQNL